MGNNQIQDFCTAINELNQTMKQILETNKKILHQLENQPYNISATFTQNGTKNKQSSSQSFIAGCHIKNMAIS